MTDPVYRRLGSCVLKRLQNYIVHQACQTTAPAVSVVSNTPDVVETGTAVLVNKHDTTVVNHTSAPANLIRPPDVIQNTTFFPNIHDFTISGSPNFVHSTSNVTTVYGGGTDPLENLAKFVSVEAKFDSSAQPDRRCHPGTRKNVLQRLQDWIDKPNPNERICWLHGPAGAGKSAIAQTIAHSYTRQKIPATFFFFRSDANRNDGNRLFTTLAHQLAFSLPAIKDYIVHSLSERPHLPTADVETQFKYLLAMPFRDLSDDANQQLAPAVHVITKIAKKHQEIAPVIIVDGVDECINEDIQRRFLKIIGDAVTDDRIPLRFLIVSRPEVHIEQIIHRFKTPIPTIIDLSKLDNANRDIERYLVNQFSRVASQRVRHNPGWPGQQVIRTIVDKSSGYFIYASIVIRIVEDLDNSAETQLDIVLNIKPPTTRMSPFAELDQLFLEILQRVPEQDFLKRYLALLLARISVSSDYNDLYKDDAVLMHVSEEDLHAKLRRTRSILKFKPWIDIYHRSFLDFLHDPSRSRQYFISKQSGTKRYMEVFVDSLERYVSTAIEQPDYAPPSTPKFRSSVARYPQKIDLPITEWQEVIQPLLDLYDKLLQLPNFTSTWSLLPYECTFSRPLREFLHAGIHAGIFNHERKIASVQSIMAVQRRRSMASSNANDSENVNYNDLDSVLLSLFVHLPEVMENWSPSEAVINRMKAILRFDHVETAMKVRFVSDAQKLVDFLYYLIKEKNTLNNIHPDAMRKAILLALKIFARVPILPLSVFNFKYEFRRYYPWFPNSRINITVPTQILTQTIFVCKVLDYYTLPISEIWSEKHCSVCFTYDGWNDMKMEEWRQEKIPDFVTIIQTMLRTAKAIQFLHSVNVFPYHDFNSADIFLDNPLLHPKFCSLFWISGFPLDEEWKESFSPEGNIFSFGCTFYEVWFGVDTRLHSSIENKRRIVTRRRSKPTIPEYVWQLIQRCCAIDPKKRPTIDQVVQEMESWNIDSATK